MQGTADQQSSARGNGALADTGRHFSAQFTSQSQHADYPRPWYVLHAIIVCSCSICFIGGGFIAGSPRSHESYLRFWACDIRGPILSIDYSLAPESPWPAALNECVYAYAWALANADKLGTTAEHVYFIGDSAGGNLIIAMTLRCIQLVRSINKIHVLFPDVPIFPGDAIANSHLSLLSSFNA